MRHRNATHPNRHARLGRGLVAALGAASLSGCVLFQPPGGNEFVFLGESNLNGESAAQSANLIVQRANGEGCRGLSVGGYAATIVEAGQIVYGVPVMVSCPAGVVLQPNGMARP